MAAETGQLDLRWSAVSVILAAAAAVAVDLESRVYYCRTIQWAHSGPAVVGSADFGPPAL